MYSLLTSWQPLIIALNKKDVVTRDDLSPAHQERLLQLEKDGVIVHSMSTLSEDGVDDVRNTVRRLFSV